MHPHVRQLYKDLLHIGREYPKGFSYFRAGLKKVFLKKKDLDLSDAQVLKNAIDHGRFVYKELEALWFLKKYRVMKKNYYDDQELEKRREKAMEKIEKN
jgi:hypothetical protein